MKYILIVTQKILVFIYTLLVKTFQQLNFCALKSSLQYLFLELKFILNPIHNLIINVSNNFDYLTYLKFKYFQFLIKYSIFS